MLLEGMRYHLYDACSGWQTFPLSRKLYLTEQTVCRLLHAILVPFVKKSETHKFRPVYSPLVQSSLSDFQVTQFITFKLFKLRKPAKVLNRCDYFLDRFLLFPLSQPRSVLVTQHTLAPNKKNGRDEKNSLRKPSRFLSSRQEKREWSESRARAWGERARKKSAAPSTSLINETQRRVTKASRPKNVRVRKKNISTGELSSSTHLSNSSLFSSSNSCTSSPSTVDFSNVYN